MADINAIKAAIQKATQASNQSGADYSNMLNASGGIQQALQRALQAADPTMGQLRDEQTAANTRLGSVFANSLPDLQNVTDPTVREAIRSKQSAELGSEAAGIGGKISDLGGSQDKTVSNLKSIYDAATNAKQFDVTQKDKTLAELQDEQKTADQQDYDAKQTAAQQAYDAQQKELDRQNAIKTALIAHSGSGSSGGLTTAELLANPRLALEQAGGKAVPDASGGFNFYDASGNPINVQQAAAMVPGASVATMLKDSSNANDQALISGKTSATQQASDQVANDTKNAIAQLQGDYNKMGQSNNPLLSFLKGGWNKITSNTPINGNAKQYGKDLNAVIGLIMKGRGINRFNMQEAQNMIKSLPGFTDTQSQGTRDFQNALDLVNGKVSAPAPAGAAPKTMVVAGQTYVQGADGLFHAQ